MTIISRFFYIICFCSLLLGLGYSDGKAACSEYMGQVTINELYYGTNSFIEFKLLNANIPPSVYGSWKYQLYNEKEGLSGFISVPADSSTLPWIVTSTLNRKFLDFSKGMDLLLVDGQGDPIDYFSVIVTEQKLLDCSFAYDTDALSTNSFILARMYNDGTGDWAAIDSGNSGETTVGDTNDGYIAVPFPRLIVDNVEVTPGETALLSFYLVDETGAPATFADPVSFNYQTIDGTALAGEDYTSISGTLLIPAGSSQATVSVNTSITAQGDEYFSLYLSNENNVTLLNSYPRIIFLQGPSIDHIRIEHTGTGLTCQRSDIVLRACADAICSSESTDPVTITMTPSSTNPPTWVGGDTYTFTGRQTVQLRQTVAGTVSLGLTNPNPIPTNGYRCYDSGVEGNCDIDFYESGFIFAVPDLTSCETSPTVSIQAVRADDTAQTCIADAGFAGATKTINFWSTYVNPVTGTEQVSISGTDIATSPGTDISLIFDGSATSSFTVVYPDAGQMQLNARYDGVGSEEAGLVMLGSDLFIARPVGLCVYSDDANSDCAAGNGTCSVFKKVDEVFNLKVKGVCWEASGDTDYCSGNSTTQNFQLNSIPITHNLVDPTGVGVSAGSIGVTSIDIVSADNGEHVIGNQTVSEVGVFTFTATPPDYFGVALPVATSANIGRFTPDHFVISVLNDGAFQDSSTGFSYSGQMFSYAASDYPEMLISAVDSDGNITVNYRDDFIKLTDPATQIVMPTVTADASNLGADGVTLLNLSWAPAASSLTQNNDGTLDFTLGADQFTYTREANALVAPFTSDIQLSVTAITDSDGITATGLPASFFPSGTEIRYGQMQLQNAYGPETLPLAIPVLTEFYDGASFVLNDQDSGTDYNSSNILPLSPISIGTGQTTASGSGTLVLGQGNDQLGNTYLELSAPGVGNDGSIDLEYDLDAAGLEWLKPDGNNPTAKATFGIFKGNQQLIYMRESVW